VASQGKGTIKPFELAVEALQDVNKLTDVTVTTTVIASGFSAPTSSKHIQLKSFDTSNQLRWTKNQQDVALIPNGSFSITEFQYNDMTRYQPVQVQEQVQNAQTGNTVVLNAKGIVKLRPDVSVDNVAAPASVLVGQVANITASLRELNGDLGAVTNVVLNDGATMRDHADGVQVNPHADIGVVFVARFDQVGTYELKVVAQNVVPGDYDGSNKPKTITIQVVGVENRESVPYYLDYRSNGNDYFNTWSDWYGSGTDQQRGTYENLWEGLYLFLENKPLNFLIDKVDIQISADNVLKTSVTLSNIQAQSSGSDGCNYYDIAAIYAGDGVGVHLQTWGNCSGYMWSFAQFCRWAYDYLYFSSAYSA
jgi:hypothetical protein